ncbi:RNA polymerase sigma factor [Algoriphagus antarcticus]|uniref:RNA polymerase sigma-70 factor (ECF subfamily) n=1 Tax=Algoriphagus antarcticus TaxID=238540 RepID=A0A3E0E0A6_9BACT|nr:RNA polymerase sigma-70 factor [Algoriphagus antarcticus]REG90306.1 RNA polymerase sigma-70 factor (ECF subfamily) [Algoriphagus antarcticus]
MGNLSNHNDQELLIKLRQGNVPAFDELYHRYVKKSMAFALTFFPSKELAKDAVQDIFIRIWERRSELDDSKSFKTYLFQSVKFYMYNYARDKKPSCTLEEAPESVFLRENKVENDLAYQDLELAVFSLVEKLPKVQQEVFRLNKLEGFTASEIAKRMNLSQRTIEHHIYLSTKTIKKELGGNIFYPSSLTLALLHFSLIL